MSLWTPDGEHQIPAERAAATSGANETSPVEPASVDGEPTEEELREHMAQLQAQLLSAPAGAVVGNHVVAMLELAALHLSNPSGPTFDDARVALDAAGAVLEALQGQLGADEAELVAALAQMRLMFVQIKAGAAVAPD